MPSVSPDRGLSQVNPDKSACLFALCSEFAVQLSLDPQFIQPSIEKVHSSMQLAKTTTYVEMYM